MPSEQPSAATHCRLYLISPERIEHPSIFADELRAALDGGDVAAFQLRLKDVDDDAIARAADTLRPICQQRDVAFIMNDRPDLAVKLDCDGVHVGQEDMPYAEARRIVGPDRQVGVTCKASRAPRHGGGRSRRRLRGVRRVLPVDHQGRHHAGRRSRSSNGGAS